MRTPLEMMEFMKKNSILKEKTLNMSEEELEGKIIVGEFVDKSRPEYSERLCELVNEKCEKGTPLESIKSAYKS